MILAVQMSQSGQLTLELPYVIIGLGSTPNFVEKITVGVPPSTESVRFIVSIDLNETNTFRLFLLNFQHKLIRTYTQMIPNSQVVVVPSPLSNPDK